MPLKNPGLRGGISPSMIYLVLFIHQNLVNYVFRQPVSTEIELVKNHPKVMALFFSWGIVIHMLGIY